MLGRKQHSHAQKKRQRKSKKTNADNGGSTKNEEASRSLRPPRSSTRLQDSEAPAPINTLRKDRDDDDAVANGFPRYTTRREDGLQCVYGILYILWVANLGGYDHYLAFLLSWEGGVEEEVCPVDNR